MINQLYYNLHQHWKGEGPQHLVIPSSMSTIHMQSEKKHNMSAPCRKSYIKWCLVEKIMNHSGLSVISYNRKVQNILTESETPREVMTLVSQS